MNVALQLSEIANFLITFALLGSFLADPGPPEANTTVRIFQNIVVLCGGEVMRSVLQQKLAMVWSGGWVPPPPRVSEGGMTVVTNVVAWNG